MAVLERGPTPATLRSLRRIARTVSVVAHEAEDLVQDVLLFALAEKRNCADPAFLPWAAGAIRNHARFVARTSGRRRLREAAHGRPAAPEPAELPRFPRAFLTGLPRSRRVVAQLVNLGMDRREIGYLLGLGEVALRQRIAGLKRAWLGFAGDRDAPPPAPEAAADGRARRALKAGLLPVKPRAFAIRDPDGIPIFFASDGHVRNRHGN